MLHVCLVVIKLHLLLKYLTKSVAMLSAHFQTLKDDAKLSVHNIINIHEISHHHFVRSRPADQSPEPKLTYFWATSSL